MSRHEPRSGAQAAAVRAAASASKSGFHRMDETEFLLSCPENARRLRRSIADVKAGKVFEHELIECD